MDARRRLIRSLAAIVAIASGAGLIFAAYVYFASERVIHRQYKAPFETVAVPTDPASIAEGRRLATIRGCNGGCHGAGIEGEVWMDTFSDGRAVAPNLTVIAHEYSTEELVRVIRYGVRPNGEGVQIMPSPMFFHLSDADMGKIIAFLRSEPRVDGHSYEFRPGPLTRWLMAKGEWLPWPAAIAEMGSRMSVFSQTDTLMHGEYLVRTSCTECHGNDLRGDPFGSAPDLAVAGAYSAADFAQLMRTGVGIGDRQLGLMSRVAQSRFRHFTDDEIGAIHAFLHARAFESRRQGLAP